MNDIPDWSESSYKPFPHVLPSILLLTFVFLLNFISRLIFAPLLPLVEQDLGLSHTDAGSFFLLISSGYFVSILSSGFVSARLSHKRTIVASTVLTGCALAGLSFCATIEQIRLGLFCLGLGAGLYLPSGIASITKMVPPAFFGRALAVHELAPNLGFVAAPVIAATLTGWYSWTQSLLLLGFVLLGVASVYGVCGSSRAGCGVAPSYGICRDIMGTAEFWVMAVLFSLAICSTLGIFAMLPLFLVVEKDLGYIEANYLVSWSRGVAVIMPFIGGWIGDRFGNRRVMAAVLFGIGLLTIPLGLLSGNALFVVIILQAMLAACFFPSGLAVLSSIGGGRWGNVPLSLCVPIAFLFGAGIMPLCIGIIGDHFNLGTGFVSIGVLSALVGALALSGLWVHRDEAIETGARE